jgi:hypothetical protein
VSIALIQDLTNKGSPLRSTSLEYFSLFSPVVQTTLIPLSFLFLVRLNLNPHHTPNEVRSHDFCQQHQNACYTCHGRIEREAVSKAPVKIPASASADPAAALSIRALVFKAAQSKLRLKKPTRVYVGRTSRELLAEEDWRLNVKDDIVLPISAGEVYVGAKNEENVHGKYNPG